MDPAATGGHVVPLYDTTPAPMGIATYGLRNVNGVTTPYVLNTKSVEASFTASDPTGVQTQGYGGGGQTTWGAQLNVIETNTTLKGQTSFLGNTNQFWLQNVINYNPSTGSLSFLLNIWNFSYNNQGATPWAGYSYFPSNTILHGSGSVGGSEYYSRSASGPTVAYPFTIQLYINTTVGNYLTSPKVDEVYFNYSVWNGVGVNVAHGSYDNVYFNSVTAVNPNTAQIQANGYHYASNGGGTNLDMELDVGIGQSSAYTTHTVYANSQLGLFTLNATTGKFQTVPSAYDFGSETGEDTIGSYGTWSIGSNGAPVEQLRTGPSILTGLWNASMNPTANAQAPASTPGAYALNYANVEPENAWVAIAPGGGQTNQQLFQVAPTFGWFNRPTSGGSLGPNMWLQPGVYTVEVMLSGYNTFTETVSLLSGNVNLNVALTANPASTTYTPLYAFSNAELASISTSGIGTASNPYILWHNQLGSLAAVFGSLSQWPFEIWEGVYVNATTAHANWAPLPSLSITYPWWTVPALLTTADGPLPLTNHLQIYLYHTQNLTIANSGNISGWFASAGTTGYSLVANDVKNVLIANNHFNVSNLGLEFITGGTNNTVWGNTFNPFPQYLTQSGVEHPSTGLTVSESGDHIYNNAFYTNGTAASSSSYTNFWNVTGGTQPTSYVNTVNGFALTGTNILGQNYQGGNYWFNYGMHADPYGLLPYIARASNPTATGSIGKVGTGDFAPLTIYGRIGAGLYPVTFTESGLAAASSLAMRLANVPVYSPITGLTTLVPNIVNTTTTTTDTFWVPNGTVNWARYTVPASRYLTVPSGSVTVAGASAGVSLTFQFGYAVTFTESGITAPVRWYLNVTGQPSATSTSTTLSITLPNGTSATGFYHYALATGGNTSKTSPATGSFNVTGATVAKSVTFTAVTFTVTFTESGLPSGTKWYVNVTGQTSVNSITTTNVLTLANGSYTYAAPAANGYVATAGAFTVSGAAVGISVTFTGGGLTAPVQDDTGSAVCTPQPCATTTLTASSTLSGVKVGDVLVVVLTTIAEAVPHLTTVQLSNSYGASWTLLNVVPETWDATTTDYMYVFYSSPTTSGGAGTVAVDFLGPPSDSTTDASLAWFSFSGVNVAHPIDTYSFNNVGSGGTSPSGAITTTNANDIVFGYVGEIGAVTSNTQTAGFVGHTYRGTSVNTYLETKVVNSVGTYTSSPTLGTNTQYGIWVFALEGSSIPSSLHAVTFTETGMPLASAGFAWIVSVSGQTSVTSAVSPVVLNLPNGNYTYTIGSKSTYSNPGGLPYTGYTPSPASGTFTVNNAPVSKAITFAPTVYAVTFVETGLPGGTTWGVTVFDGTSFGQGLWGNTTTQTSTSSSISFALTNSTWGYSIANVSGYSTTQMGSLLIWGYSMTVPVAFAPVLHTNTNSLTFTETGLAPGAPWAMVLNGVVKGSTSTSLVFQSANGTFVYSVAAIPGTTANPSSGLVAVQGTTVGPTIAFSTTGYAVTFTEVGLASGTSWSVTLNSVLHTSTTNTITFSETPGTYSYSIAAIAGASASPSSGSVTVSTAAVNVPVTFSTVAYTVSFTEGGAYLGTWAVQFGGVLKSVASGTISFTVPNGTYAYVVASIAGYTATPSSGSISVAGSGSSTGITFSTVPPAAYSLEFTENGLVLGTSWSVTVTGQGTLSSTGNTITFNGLVAGTYTYSYGAVAGFTTPSGGSAVITTASVSLAVTYSAPTYAVTFTESGLPIGTVWAVSFAGQIVVSTGTSIVFHVAAGTYSYSVATTSGYAPSPASGTLIVSGATPVSITYTLIPPVPTALSVSTPVTVSGRSD